MMAYIAGGIPGDEKYKERCSAAKRNLRRDSKRRRFHRRRGIHQAQYMVRLQGRETRGGRKMTVYIRKYDKGGM